MGLIRLRRCGRGRPPHWCGCRSIRRSASGKRVIILPTYEQGVWADSAVVPARKRRRGTRRRGDFVNCTDQPTTGFDVDGGYAEVAYARASGLVRIPDGLGPIEAAPLICAGVTVYNALMQIHSRPGELVAVQGIGGLGHLAVQYAAKLGYRVAAIARDAEKATWPSSWARSSTSRARIRARRC
jgi:D-arabinose 1-dehydrogenase-like Zn-dependent alcohol dehydrogenase